MAYMNIKTLELYHTVELDTENGIIELEHNMVYPMHDFVYIDDMIAPVIQLLNKKGYKTEFCCSSHPLLTSLYLDIHNDGCEDKVSGTYSIRYPYDMYISFVKKYPLGKNLPDGWEYDKDNHSVIRYRKLESLINFDDSARDKIDGNSYFNALHTIINAIESFYDYVKNLKSIN